MWELLLVGAVAGLAIWAYVAYKHNLDHVKQIEDELKAKVQWPLDKS